MSDNMFLLLLAVACLATLLGIMVVVGVTACG